MSIQFSGACQMIESIVHKLQILDFVEASILIPVTLGFAVFILPWLRNAIGIKTSPEVSDGLGEGFAAIALFFIFIAATSLATLQGYQKDGAKVVELELAHITSLDRDLAHRKEAEYAAARVILKKYVRAIIDDEWPLLADGEDSEKVTHIFGELVGTLNHLKTGEISDAVENRMNAVSESREERIEVANLHLNKIYWGMTFAFIFLMVAISAFTHISLAKRAALCGKMVAIAFTLVMLVQTDGVFSGDISIKPTGYEKLLKKMTARTADGE